MTSQRAWEYATHFSGVAAGHAVCAVAASLDGVAYDPRWGAVGWALVTVYFVWRAGSGHA
ncbi:hypothetical protein K0U83_27285 [bacterium]|nr:hypothetical protein [bacterium]